MFRTLKIGSVLAATTAALAIGVAVPASAAPTGAQSVTGTAYLLPNFLGASEALIDTNGGCQPFSAPLSLLGAQSATNSSASTDTVTFYSGSNCTGSTTSVAPGSSNSNFGFTAFSYSTQ
ncbi:hypothetical protein [Streptomyces sp. NPDC046939]|uniref:hypothetical protein n=1 Tax=Streptomyces sp. NPDC046939 TaxID=3155376 RepID=UPI0033C919AC